MVFTIKDIASQVDYENTVDEMRGEQIMIILFYANWCGPYKRALPQITKLARDLKDKCSFYKLNVTDHEDITKLCQIYVLPTYLVFSNGKVIDVVVTPGLEKLRKKIELHQRQHRRKYLHRQRYLRTGYEYSYGSNFYVSDQIATDSCSISTAP